jgi:hypothetical protein
MALYVKWWKFTAKKTLVTSLVFIFNFKNKMDKVYDHLKD